MYIGHVAVALAAVHVRREAPLWILIVASQWPDWVQLFLEALGAWNAQLYSHSIPAVLAGSLLFALVFLRWSGDVRGAMLVAAMYLTHPVLDLVTGLKPLWPGGPLIGANWYDQPVKDFVLEVALLLLGWLTYRATIGARRRERLVWVLLVALAGCQALLDAGQQLRLMRRARGDDAPSTFGAT